VQKFGPCRRTARGSAAAGRCPRTAVPGGSEFRWSGSGSPTSPTSTWSGPPAWYSSAVRPEEHGRLIIRTYWLDELDLPIVIIAPGAVEELGQDTLETASGTRASAGGIVLLTNAGDVEHSARFSASATATGPSSCAGVPSVTTTPSGTRHKHSVGWCTANPQPANTEAIRRRSRWKNLLRCSLPASS
jgi:hypothetical protein